MLPLKVSFVHTNSYLCLLPKTNYEKLINSNWIKQKKGPLCLILPTITAEIQTLVTFVFQLFYVSHRIYRKFENAEGRQSPTALIFSSLGKSQDKSCLRRSLSLTPFRKSALLKGCGKPSFLSHHLKKSDSQQMSIQSLDFSTLGRSINFIPFVHKARNPSPNTVANKAGPHLPSQQHKLPTSLLPFTSP